MIYPNNFENKIGFHEVRLKLRACCLSPLGEEQVEAMEFSTDVAIINKWLAEIREFRSIEKGNEEFPLSYFFDMRQSVSRIRLEGTMMEIEELFDLKRSLETIIAIVAFLSRSNSTEGGEEKHLFPALYNLVDGISTFPLLVKRIAQIIDRFGKMRDAASPELLRIRRDLEQTERSISGVLYNILRKSQAEGLVDKDVVPTMRDGRLVIPVAPAMKRRLSGIVHDESATGKTVFIEPAEVVEANNKVRELKNEERREIVRILKEFANNVRPYVSEILDSYSLLGQIDFIRAKAQLANIFNSYEPEVSESPIIDWIHAYHPLLEQRLGKEKIVPLDIHLTDEGHLLIISGPNAGGKSVCLKTVGLLQYMLQCGLSVPIGDRSKVGVFHDIMIDIGDEQSIENDLSTYSSHLMNMKLMMRQSSERTLILIDEFGTGTEPQIGGAIAEAVLKQFWKKKVWAVITTHYQNLKHFAKVHKGVMNGAMLYDRHEMKPLFQLSTGRPGSSFAIEIARKTGLSEEVIKDASKIVGSDYIQSDKYLQDIVRDKRYWEGKRQEIHAHEKELEKRITQYEKDIALLEKSKKEILDKAKKQAEEIIRQSNKLIENVIKEIREQQADKKETKRIREQLAQYEANLLEEPLSVVKSDRNNRKGASMVKAHGLLTDDEFQKKADSIKSRKERHKQHLLEKNIKQNVTLSGTKGAVLRHCSDEEITIGSTVHIKGLTTEGRVETIKGKQAVVIFGGMRSTIAINRLERVSSSVSGKDQKELQSYHYSKLTRNTIDEHRNNFRQEIDVRGMRTDDAILRVQQFIDDAILVGGGHFRIIHGKGNGILRIMIRKYLQTIPNVLSFRDEHIQFGGTGITVVEI